MKKLAYLLVIVPMLWGCETENSYSDKGDIEFESTSAESVEMDYTESEAPEGYSSGNGLTAKFADSQSPDAAPQKQSTAEQPKEIPKSDKKLIKKGEMTIEVKELKSSKKRMDETVKSLGGYYDNENYQEEYRSLTYDLKIRIPVNQFDKLVSSLEGGFDKILDKNVSTVDVTSRYVDLESRLTSKRVSLDRYRAILKSAKTIKEILEVEEYIRKIEEEIESTMVQLKQLNGQTSYSTLSVSLTQPVKVEIIVEDGPGFWSKAGNSVVSGWHGLESFVLILLRVWPFLILIAGLVVALKWFRGR